MTDTPQGALPLPVVPGLTDLSVFARGGYATVYRAVQQSIGREVAVKVENRTLESERDQQRFLREARAAGRMSSHPHVVDLFDAGVTADRHPYLIMELCDGSYAERMRTSPLGAPEARDLGVKIADALADAHQLGVLHRDVKPANILYSRFGEPTLADFGLAVIAEVRDPSVTLEALTPAYAPPEMFRPSPPAPAVDVYALCATLYAVMNGKPPRWKDDANPGLITLMELFDEPIPDLPGIPSVLVDVLRYGMANDPEARPSAAQLRDLLAAVPLGPPPHAPTMPGAAGAAVVPGAAGYLSPSYGTPPPTAFPAPVPAAAVPTTVEAAPAGSAPHAPWPQPAAAPDRGAERGRWQTWIAGVAGVLLLLGAVSAGAWYGSTRPGSAPAPDSTRGLTEPSGTPSPTPVPVGGALPGCLIPLPGGGRCPTELECFGPVRTTGSGLRAERVSCTGRHTWETYALSDLPADLLANDQNAIEADPVVQQVCGQQSFLLATMTMTVTDWRFLVLPPAPEAVERGDRTYRCLAGRGPDGLDGPTLAR
ncbi:MAG TPA: serine/threonine-protein kinase [Micromonospora sp.]|nr:serine/threonine-protein kinase [Micromonospora sp.]